jgi:hypothetical protein
MDAAADKSVRDTLRIWIWVALFAIAFAYVESAVVVYLRKIYFESAFEFPIATMWENGRHVLEPLILVEMGRETATIVMLAAAEILAGANGLQRHPESHRLVAFHVCLSFRTDLFRSAAA